MKYEITKGAKEEFELAPDWAALVVAGRHYSKAWISHYANGARALAFGTKDEYVIEAIHDCEIIAERRPITEPAWSGEGLPPVGCACEFKAEDGGWGVGTILCVGSHRVFWLCHEDKMEYNAEINPPEFRPIRYPEDVARDEAIEAMRDVGYTLPAAIRFTKEEMSALYDAGYRKME